MTPSEQLLISYRKLSDTNKELGRKISGKISDCLFQNGLPPRGRTHIAEVLEDLKHEGQHGERSWIHHSEFEMRLSDLECQHCLDAWRFLAERKVVRSKLGVVKSKMMKLGKALANGGLNER
jgi:hypothetical protein